MRLFRKTPKLQEIINRLADHHNIPQEILSRLEHYIRQADDRELYQVNPRYIAHKLDIDIHTTLGIMACAVQQGLFDLNWQVHCPHCQGQSRLFFTLQESTSQEYCTRCQVNFSPHLDHQVRVTFTISQAVRQLSATEPLPDEPFTPTSGLELLNVQPFRDLFADQILPPGESLKIKRIVFLFTDLRGSTAMYARHGDPKAYGWVRDHFQVLFEAADRNRGVTIKTIGDAVMASFIHPLDALCASIDASKGIQDLNQQLGLEGDQALSIRQGAHVGPCISVTLNERLDYFGATVNIASRTSHLSTGNDVVLTPAVMEDQEVQAKAAKHGDLENFQAKLHGYDQRFELYRLILPG